MNYLFIITECIIRWILKRKNKFQKNKPWIVYYLISFSDFSPAISCKKAPIASYKSSLLSKSSIPLDSTPSMYCFISSSIDGNSCFNRLVHFAVDILIYFDNNIFSWWIYFVAYIVDDIEYRYVEWRSVVFVARDSSAHFKALIPINDWKFNKVLCFSWIFDFIWEKV